MKTIKLFIVLLTITAFATSCTKDEVVADAPLAVTQRNLMGRYTITSLVKYNGETIPFKGYCATKQDVLDVKGFSKVLIEKYDTDCGIWQTYPVAVDFVLEADGRITQNTSTLGYFEGRITELTATKFRIVFDSPTYINNHVSEAGGIKLYNSILYKRI